MINAKKFVNLIFITGWKIAEASKEREFHPVKSHINLVKQKSNCHLNYHAMERKEQLVRRQTSHQG
jgi:hypothetical protein